MPNNSSSSSHWFQGTLTADLVNVALAVFIVFLGLQLLIGLSAINKIEPGQQRTITVDATGEAHVTPDVAQVAMGLTTIGKTVAEAQQKNTDSMNGFIKRLESIGVAAKDRITSNYNVQPHYEYSDRTKKSEITGYEVSNTITVKVRDRSNVSQVVGLASDFGLNQVGGLAFTLDNPDAAKDQARIEAFQKARAKAKAMAGAAGIRLGRVISVSESGGTIPPMPMMYGAMAKDMASVPVRPEIEPGTQDVNVTVSMTFEIL